MGTIETDGGGRGLRRASPKRAMALGSLPHMFLLSLVLLLASLESLHGSAGATGLPVQHSDGLDYPYADSYASDQWSSNWDILSGRHNQAKCIDIPTNLSLCRNIGYNQMRLPNLLDHDTLSEVVQQASSWVPLLGIRCHPDTKLFLCSLFSPVCLDRPIWPCRSLCNSVKTSCIRFMSKYGFPWPDMLRCDKFPLDNDLCIGLQNEQKQDDRVCNACKKPETFESIVHNYCDADFAIKMRVQENVIVGQEMKLIPHRRRKFLKKGDMRRRDMRHLELFVDNGRDCDCPTVANATTETSTRNYFLVMGKMMGGKAMVSYVNPYNRRSKAMRKAMKSIRKPDICKTPIPLPGDNAAAGSNPEATSVAASAGPEEPTVATGGRRRNRKPKGNRKKERGNGRQRGRNHGPRNRNQDDERNRRRNRRNRDRDGRA